MIKLKIEQRGTMLVDYFSGTPGVMLSVSVDNKTTIKEVLDRLEDEINSIWDHIEYTAEYHGFDTKTLEYYIDEQIAEMSNYVMTQGTMNSIFNPDLDFCFDDLSDDDWDFMDLPVAIFTIEFEEV